LKPISESKPGQSDPDCPSKTETFDESNWPNHHAQQVDAHEHRLFQRWYFFVQIGEQSWKGSEERSKSTIATIDWMPIRIADQHHFFQTPSSLPNIHESPCPSQRLGYLLKIWLNFIAFLSQYTPSKLWNDRQSRRLQIARKIPILKHSFSSQSLKQMFFDLIGQERFASFSWFNVKSWDIHSSPSSGIPIILNSWNPSDQFSLWLFLIDNFIPFRSLLCFFLS
jgi:hypothetical protein